MRITRRHARTIGLAVGLPTLVLGAAWAGFHTRARFAWWDWLASGALGERDQERLDRCDPDLGWSTWLRVLERDADVSCGERFVAEQLADRVHGGDRTLWLAAVNSDPSAPVGRRVRAGAALALSGTPAPVEPAWLLAELPPERRVSWTAAAAGSQALGVQLGPAARAFGLVAAARDGEVPVGEALGAMRFLAAIDDPLADGAVTAAATAVLEADPTLPTRAHERPGSLGHLPRGWRSTLHAHAGCEPRCGGLWLELVERETLHAALERGEPTPADPVPVPGLAELLEVAGWPASARRAASWGLAALTEWVAAAPDPAARLRAFVARPEGGPADVLALAWDGGGSPFLTAAIATMVGEKVGLEADVRARPGEVWVGVGGAWAVRGCAGAAGDPPPDRWERASIEAASLLELAAGESDLVSALRLATAAARLDPLVGAPTAERMAAAAADELQVGRRIGAALPRSLSPPTTAEEARRAIGASGVGCGGPS